MGVLRHHFYFEPYSCTAYVQLYVRVARGVQQSDLHPFVVAARAGEHNPAHPSFPRDLAIAETVILMAPPLFISLLKHLMKVQRGCHQMTVSSGW